MCLREVPIRRACEIQANRASLRQTLFAEPAIQDRLIGINATVAEEWPTATRLFAFRRITFDHQNFFVFASGLRDDLTKRIGDERISPEFDSWIARGRIAFVAHSIHHRDKCSIGDSVRALDGAPRVELRRAEFGFFLRVPADAGWVKNHLCALQSSEARTLRVPLIPANLNSDPAELGVKIWKTKVSRREIKFLVIKWIVGNMHFAIFAEERAVSVQHSTGIVVDARGAPFKK